MARFTTHLKSLTLQDEKGVWAQFADGEFETTDAAVVKRLKALPEEYGVTVVSAKAGAADDGGDGSGETPKTDGQ